MNWEEMAVVGSIARPHGLRGRVVVNPETDFPLERFRRGAELIVQRGVLLKTLRVETVRFQRARPIIGFEGIDTIDEAENLAGLELRVPVSQLLPLPSGSYYQHNLVGCRVTLRDGGEVGTVREVEMSLGSSRLVVDGTAGEILIPLAEPICTAIDLDAKTIVIDPPEGLLDLNAARARQGRRPEIER
jgi:16S rRNA processing protein RimM